MDGARSALVRAQEALGVSTNAESHVRVCLSQDALKAALGICNQLSEAASFWWHHQEVRTTLAVITTVWCDELERFSDNLDSSLAAFQKSIANAVAFAIEEALSGVRLLVGLWS